MVAFLRVQQGRKVQREIGFFLRVVSKNLQRLRHSAVHVMWVL